MTFSLMKALNYQTMKEILRGGCMDWKYRWMSCMIQNNPAFTMFRLNFVQVAARS